MMILRMTTRSVGLIAWLVLATACAQTPPVVTDVPTEALTPTAVLTPTIAPLPTLTPVRTPPVNGLYVDPAAEQGEISPLVYGTNYGPWTAVPVHLLDAAKNANLSIVRFPGGNWGDLNDLKEYQIDGFMSFTKMMGAEATINVRLKNGTAEKAAELVRMVNIEKEYGVKYWAIGNEPNLFPDDYSVEQYNKDWREWAIAMREVDPTIQLIGPEVSQFYDNPPDAYGQNIVHWVEEFLKANGDMVDIVSFHRYPFPASLNSGGPSPEELLASSREWDALIPAMRALVREHTGRDLPIAVTEVNSSWVETVGADASLDSHANGIWWGDSLGRMIRQGTFMVNQFALSSDYGLIGGLEINPIYYVYEMYRHFGTVGVYAASDDPDVSIFAARREDGALTVMIVNLSQTEVDQTLSVEGMNEVSASEAWLFDETHAAETVEAGNVIEGNTVNLPPMSMTLLVIEP